MKNVAQRAMKFDLDVEIYSPQNDNMFKDEFTILSVEDYDRNYENDAVKIVFQPTKKPFNITEIINVVDGGKLTLLLKKMFPRKKNISVALDKLEGKKVKMVAVKKISGYFTLFPEVTHENELETDEWK